MKELLQDVTPSRELLSSVLPTASLEVADGVNEILADKVEMKFQMTDFAREMNKGALSALIKAHPRGEGIAYDNYQIGLVPFVRKDTNGKYVTDERFSGTVFLDGDYGFGLVCTPPQTYMPRLIAATSFLAKDRLPDYFFKHDPFKTIPEGTPDSLVIVQIQGPSSRIMYKNSSALYTSSLPVVQSFQYQRVLVSTVIAFADHIGIENIGILAASRNKNRTLPLSLRDYSAPVEQLQPHYDLTAKKMGFTMQKDGIHHLSLV